MRRTWTIELNLWALLLSLGWFTEPGENVRDQSSEEARAAQFCSILLKLAISACSTSGLKSFSRTGERASPRDSSNEQCPKQICTHSVAALRFPEAADWESDCLLTKTLNFSVSLTAHVTNSDVYEVSSPKTARESPDACAMVENTSCDRLVQYPAPAFANKSLLIDHLIQVILM